VPRQFSYGPGARETLLAALEKSWRRTFLRPCKRKANRPPGEAALAAAAALAGTPREVVVSLDDYAAYAEVAR
jgi:hypothetical protein